MYYLSYIADIQKHLTHIQTWPFDRWENDRTRSPGYFETPSRYFLLCPSRPWLCFGLPLCMGEVFPSQKRVFFSTEHQRPVWWKMEPQLMPKGRGWNDFLTVLITVVGTQTQCYLTKCRKRWGSARSHLSSCCPLKTTSVLTDVLCWEDKVTALDPTVSSQGLILWSPWAACGYQVPVLYCHPPAKTWWAIESERTSGSCSLICSFHQSRERLALSLFHPCRKNLKLKWTDWELCVLFVLVESFLHAWDFST